MARAEHMWINGDQCVSDCGAGKIPDENRRCIPCDKACPKGNTMALLRDNPNRIRTFLLDLQRALLRQLYI